MSSQIDPVTNLPIFVPPPLEQIPFKNPPYPWNDLTDNPVTPRTTYYGDDSIPTVATIAGMHPTQPGGQTVNTDGNHALLVNDIGGGGGGGSVNLVTHLTVQQDQRRFNTGTGGTFNDISAVPTSDCNKIFGVSYYAAFIVDGTSRTGTSFMAIAGNNGDPANFFLWGDNQFGVPNLPTGSLVVIKDSMIFPWPLSIPDIWPRSDHIYVNAQCSYPQFSFEASLLAGV